MAGTDKVKSPFSRNERNQLLAWSKFAKERSILDGFQRKILYEGGHYNYVFVSRLNLITNALKILCEHLDNEGQDVAQNILLKSYVCFLDTHAGGGNAEAKYLLADGYYWGKYGLEENENEALRLLKEAVNQQYGDALAMLGHWHENGILVEEDKDAAFKLYAEAHGLDSIEGTFRLALSYEAGIGVKADENRAFEYMKEAADKKLPKAMSNLGEYYSFATGTSEDMALAVHWWKEAAEQNNENALFWLGMSHWLGDGVEEDAGLAADYFEKAHDAGNCLATHRLGMAYFLGIGREEDEQRAAELFNDAHAMGYVQGTYQLAFCLQNGIGLTADPEQAFNLFEQCCDEIPRAYFHLGEAAREGLGRPKNFETAFDYYLKAADQDIDSAKTAIGRAFFLGEGVPENDADAVKWLSLSVEDDEIAQYYLGQCYYSGLGTPEDESLGINLLRKSAANGMDDAKQLLFNLGYALEDSLEHSTGGNGNVVSVHRDRTSRAELIFRRFENDLSNIAPQHSATVTQLHSNLESRIEELMADDLSG